MSPLAKLLYPETTIFEHSRALDRTGQGPTWTHSQSKNQIIRIHHGWSCTTEWHANGGMQNHASYVYHGTSAAVQAGCNPRSAFGCTDAAGMAWPPCAHALHSATSEVISRLCKSPLPGSCPSAIRPHCTLLQGRRCGGVVVRAAMFDSLSRGLDTAWKLVSNDGKLTKENMVAPLKEVRTALLEADVSVGVVKSFMARLEEKAIGQEVSFTELPELPDARALWAHSMQEKPGPSRRSQGSSSMPAACSGSPKTLSHILYSHVIMTYNRGPHTSTPILPHCTRPSVLHVCAAPLCKCACPQCPQRQSCSPDSSTQPQPLKLDLAHTTALTHI